MWTMDLLKVAYTYLETIYFLHYLHADVDITSKAHNIFTKSLKDKLKAVMISTRVL